ncbi:MAG TPA: hypothetical protein VEY96_02455 [Actinomycetes bacterium]|nr:hypothetical protein [Actinomycetes bacterium]
MRWSLILVAAGPALLLAGLGLTHPHDLTSGSADWWTTLHVLLLPLFPLLGVVCWLLLRGVPGVEAWVGRLAAFGYIAFYTALDVLAGVGTGTLVQRLGEDAAGEEVGALFAAGNELGTIGTWCFLVACLATSAAIVRWVGRGALPGAVVLVAAALSFLDSHIYWPVGVLTMVGLAVGFGLLAASLPVAEREPAAASPSQPG